MINLYKSRSELVSKASDEATCWEGSPYYDEAERWMHVFWGDQSRFIELFSRLDLECVLELACGHGRHGEQVLAHYGEKIKKLIMMDILKSNIEFCKKRIHNKKVALIKNDGVHFNRIDDDSCTSVFCYDAMVHFDKDVIISYLRETYRVLRPGGMGLFHHSNYTQNAEAHFSQNPHARAFMSADLFADYVKKAGLHLVGQKVIPWGSVPELDCITLVAKG